MRRTKKTCRTRASPFLDISPDGQVSHESRPYLSLFETVTVSSGTGMTRSFEESLSAETRKPIGRDRVEKLAKVEKNRSNSAIEFQARLEAWERSRLRTATGNETQLVRPFAVIRWTNSRNHQLPLTLSRLYSTSINWLSTDDGCYPAEQFLHFFLTPPAHPLSFHSPPPGPWRNGGESI